jgi:phosphatidylglycerol lysyltransferase
MLIIADTLFTQFGTHRFVRQLPDIGIVIDLPLLAGLILLYLSLSLRRQKWNAWVFTSALYIFLLGLNSSLLIHELHIGVHPVRLATLIVPLLMLLFLWAVRHDFVVRSDTRTFTSSLKISFFVLLAAFLYGAFGFLLMDKPDFHQEISLPSAMHYTVDQFALTTNPLHPYTRRAVLFQDSLMFISVTAVGLALISLFQPLRARYTHQKEWYDRARAMVYTNSMDSEDFFKLWPHDKTYFFSTTGRSGMAYKVQRGVALAVGDPFGEPKDIKRLLKEFEDLCFGNDWRPAFVHTTERFKKLFAAREYRQQLIGEEALVELDHFVRQVAPQKYFREIQRRFVKQGYTFELLQPPHHTAVLDRLKTISDEWLERPGRTERRFMMGFFSDEYMQQCRIAIARDAAGTIQAFMNLLPTPYPEEADYDILRSGKHAAGNINDYLLMQVMTFLHDESTAKRLNMGLCPLAGLEDEPNTLINRTLRFVYSNGDRFYSFRGLYKFKAKYEPVWHDRYIVYRGNAADFTRVMTALNRAMKF